MKAHEDTVDFFFLSKTKQQKKIPYNYSPQLHLIN